MITDVHINQSRDDAAGECIVMSQYRTSDDSDGRVFGSSCGCSIGIDIGRILRVRLNAALLRLKEYCTDFAQLHWMMTVYYYIGFILQSTCTL